MPILPRHKDQFRAHKHSYGKWVGLALLCVTLIVAWFLLPVGKWAGSLQAWIDHFGPWGPLVFGLIYVVAVVLLVPGSALTLAAGFAYGAWGAPLAVVAATIGASLAFLIARYMVREKVRSFMRGRRKLQAVEKAVNEDGWKIVGLVRLSPLVPFNMQNYFFGITDIPFAHYVAATFIGIIPGAVVNVYVGMIGGIMSDGAVGGPLQWSFFAVGLVVSVVVAWMITRKAKEKLSEAGVDVAKSV
jgi:uncharacterized membrane protein YdjX (TVP38/TMEM64 family)